MFAVASAASRLAQGPVAEGTMSSRCAAPARVKSAAASSGRPRCRGSGGEHSLGGPCAGAARSRRSCRRLFPGLVCAAQHDGNGSEELHNLVIVGSGPAGYTAGIYAGRASLRPLLFEGVQTGGVPGGQLMTTTEVENFPGFPDGVTGPDLMDRMRKQAARWGAALVTEDVEEVDLSVRPFRVRSSERTVRAHTIIVATGATAKRLGLPNEHTFWSRGISACAICDGASPLFKGADVAVIGGGDSAAEEAVYLTKYARQVHLIVRGPKMRASAAMAERVGANPRVTIHFKSQPVDVVGDVKGRLAALRLRDADTGHERELPVRGVFYAVGHSPNSQLLAGQVELDAAGYVVVRHGTETSVPGVFAAGDLHDTEWRQAITAAGSGCAAAISAERYLVASDLSVDYSHAADAPVAMEHAQEAAAHAAHSAAAATAAAAAASAPAPSPAEFDVSATVHVGQFALRKLYHESQRPMIVVYTSSTCGPCRRLKPMLTSLVEDPAYASAVHYVEIDIEADPDIAEAAGITGTPTVQIFHRKERLHVLPGVKMKSEYRAMLDACLGRAVPV